MPITFANVAGFWALAAIPIILLIHMLQRQSRKMPVSTLFLLEQLQRESVRGRKVDRLKNSLPLWLQLLAVLILTWLLVEPRWSRPESIQRIAVVIDSSASMRAFRENWDTQLREKLPGLSRNVGQVEYHLIESHLEGSTLYSGAELEDMIAVLQEWTPFRTAHDPAPALRVGRSLAGKTGIVLFLTDHARESLSYGARLLAVGDQVDNVGFVGVEIDSTDGAVEWQALVKNHAETAQDREWFLTAGSQKTETKTISLQPGETRTLQGRFPQNTAALTLRLQPDDFDQDDTLPLMVPQPKEMRIATLGENNLDNLYRRILESTERYLDPDAENAADLVLASHNPLDSILADEEEKAGLTFPDVSIVFLNQRDVSRHFFKGSIVSSNHRLVSGLNWQGLIARNSPGMPMLENDQTLVWQGSRSLIFLREGEGKKQLFFNFDISNSNAEGLPSFIVLVHRFIEEIRAAKVAEESGNVELHQSLQFAHLLGSEAEPLLVEIDGETDEVPLSRSRYLTAPKEPGFFQVSQGEQVLFRGAAHFADSREADFSQAGSSDELGDLGAKAVEEQTQADHWWQLWVLGLLILSVVCWYFIHRPLPEAQLAN